MASIVDVTALIDDRPAGSLQRRVFALCFLVAFLDGADSQSIGVAAPLIAADLGMKMSRLGPVFSAATLGGMIGALSFGVLADRYGRKALLIGATLLFAAFTFLTTLANSFETLVACRFFVGLGLGGATPCFLTLMSEYAPPQKRAMLVSALWAGYPFGASMGGFLNGALIGPYGWRAIFQVGGVVPILVAILLAVALPESLRFLVMRGGAIARIRRIALALDPRIPADADFSVRDETLPGVGLPHLFRRGRGSGTLLLWVIFFLAFGTTPIVVLWTPTLLQQNGMDAATAARMIGIENFTSIFSMAIAGRLVDRFGPIAALTPAFILGAVGLITLGACAGSPTLVLILMPLIGLCVPLGASGAIALAAIAYPVSVRSTGVGWAMGMGRCGQVCSPLLTGLMVDAAWHADRILAVAALLPFAAGIFVVARSFQVRPSLEPSPPLGERVG